MLEQLLLGNHGSLTERVIEQSPFKLFRFDRGYLVSSLEARGSLTIVRLESCSQPLTTSGIARVSSTESISFSSSEQDTLA